MPLQNYIWKQRKLKIKTVENCESRRSNAEYVYCCISGENKTH